MRAEETFRLQEERDGQRVSVLEQDGRKIEIREVGVHSCREGS